MVEGLPHLYGHKWYLWQRQFFQNKNRFRMFTAANQVGKSVVHIWDKVDRATNIERWPDMWKEKPDLFWFFYTDSDTLSREFMLKWKRWLPQGKMKDSKQYGWKVDADRREKDIRGVQFNSGVLLEFKFYTQHAKNLQSATVFDVGTDEEVPESFWDEIHQRIAGPDGYFSAAFTATLNQQLWWRAMEGQGDAELFPDAYKFQVSKYDCQTFDDGTLGLYTEEKILRQIAMCSSQSQVDRRIYGKFSAETGRKCHTFDPNRHYIKEKPIPKDWHRYAAVDVGSGGTKGHHAAFYFVAVRPDYRLGYVYKGRKMDGGEQTTAGDVYTAYTVERGDEVMAAQTYDYHAKDFGTIAERAGDPFQMANKNHERGEEVMNTLFKNDMLYLFDTVEVNKLGGELLTVMAGQDKRKAGDDAHDACRYCLVDIPWDWTVIQGLPTEEETEAKRKAAYRPLTKEEALADEITQRRGGIAPKPEEWSEYAEEVDFWNDQYGS